MLAFMLSQVLLAQIIETDEISSVTHVFKEADAKSLVIFDVRGVLIAAKDAVLLDVNKKVKKAFLKRIFKDLPLQEQKKILSVMYQHPVQVVDPQMPKIIKDLQTRGVKTMGLTNCRTGTFGEIPSMEKWRVGVLKTQNFDFSRSFPTLKPCIFKEGTNIGRTYRSGIIFTNRQEKGPILAPFFKYANYFPKKIIFVDNDKKNLTSVEQFCKKRHIDFIGIHYTAILSRLKKPIVQKRVQLQFDILKKKHQWVSDQEADRLLKGKLCKH